MASRLSPESTIKAYEQGHVPMNQDHAVDLMMGPPVDLDKALVAKDPKKAIQAIPSQPLYHALRRRGLEDSLDVLEHISRTQFVRMMDYTAWQDDRLSPSRVFDWLYLYKNISREAVYERFRELDEEYQLAVLGPYIEMFDEEEYEKIPDSERDDLIALPCHTLHYRIKSEDKSIGVAIDDLLTCTMESDVNYAYALIAHAAHMPPTEQEALIAQFRRARLEEDGFVTAEESLRFFRPFEVEELEHKWRRASTEPGLVLARVHGNMLTQVLERGITSWDAATYESVTRGFIYVANALCAATGTEPDDEAGLRKILTHTHAMAGLALEKLIDGDLDLGVRIVAAEHPQTLFRAGLSVVRQLQDKVMDSMVSYDLPSVGEMQKSWKLDQRGRLLSAMDTEWSEIFDVRDLEILKGLFNRFPVGPDNVQNAESGNRRIMFKPMTSLVELQELGLRLTQLFALIHLASTARTREWRHLDGVLATGFAHVALGEMFTDEPLASATPVMELDRETYDMRVRDFYAATEQMLRLSAANGRWNVGAAVGVTDAVQQGMAGVSDAVMEFSLAREQAKGHIPLANVFLNAAKNDED